MKRLYSIILEEIENKIVKNFCLNLIYMNLSSNRRFILIEKKYNVFQAIMLIRHARDDKMYLYDVIEIKKETSKLFQLNGCTQ